MKKAGTAGGARKAARPKGRKAARAGATRSTRARTLDLPQGNSIDGVRHQQTAFLEAFAKIGVITPAAEMAGVDRKRHYEWLDDAERFPDYPARFAAARARSIDRIEQSVIQRGVYGWDEPVYGNMVDPKTGRSLGTRQVGTKRMFSDKLLELATKRHIPEYRERTAVEHTGPGGGPLQVLTAALPLDDVLRRFEAAKRVLEAAAPPEPPAIDVAPEPDPKAAYAAELARRNGSNGNGSGHA